MSAEAAFEQLVEAGRAESQLVRQVREEVAALTAKVAELQAEVDQERQARCAVSKHLQCVEREIERLKNDSVGTIETRILELIDENGSVLCANLPKLYKDRFKKPLDFRGLGFLKMSHLLARMDTVRYDAKHPARIRRAEDGSSEEVPSCDDTFDPNAKAWKPASFGRGRAWRTHAD